MWGLDVTVLVCVSVCAFVTQVFVDACVCMCMCVRRGWGGGEGWLVCGWVVLVCPTAMMQLLDGCPQWSCGGGVCVRVLAIVWRLCNFCVMLHWWNRAGVFARHGDKVVVVVVNEFPPMPLSWHVMAQTLGFNVFAGYVHKWELETWWREFAQRSYARVVISPQVRTVRRVGGIGRGMWACRCAVGV